MNKLSWLLMAMLVVGCEGGGGDDGTSSATSVTDPDNGVITPTTPATDGTASATAVGGTGTVSSTLNFPVEAVLAALAASSTSYVASGLDASGSSVTLTATRVPGGAKTDTNIYPQPLQTVLHTQTQVRAGTVISALRQEDFVSVGPMFVFGNNNMYGTSNYTKVSTHFSPPATSQVGVSGELYNGKNYVAGAAGTIDAWRTMWWLDADTASTAWLCVNLTVTPAGATAASLVDTECFRIDQSGAISGFRADITETGNKISFR